MRGGQQHRGMAVMTAGMHDAGSFGAIGEGVDFLYRQGIHIGAQSDCVTARAATQGADQAGTAHAFGNFDAPFPEVGGNKCAGLVYLVAQLRVRMQVMSQAEPKALVELNFGDEIHVGIFLFLCMRCWMEALASV